MNAIVDSHCHLNCLADVSNSDDVQVYLDAARARQVDYFLCVSIDLETWQEVKTIADRYPNVFASVGVHPNYKDVQEPTVAQLVELADDENIIAIGETGLDYFRSEGDLDWQRERFRIHIEAARECGKPLIIHTREAREDTIALMQQHKAEQAGGVMHCFTEDWDMASRAMDMGFYVSFSGIVTFKSAESLREVVKKMPLERMLVETDSPYLAPVPHRGKPNQPAYVSHVVQCVAELRQQSPEEIIEATTDNFFRLFSSAQR